MYTYACWCAKVLLFLLYSFFGDHGLISLVNIGEYKEKYTFLVITSHGVNVLKLDVIQLTASNI